MSSAKLNSLRRSMRPGALAGSGALAVMGAWSTASADVVISSGSTANISCASGICTPSKKNAVLNVMQLQTLLAAGNVTINTAGAKASNIVVADSVRWASSYGLTLDAYQSITLRKFIAVEGTGALNLQTNDGGSGGLLSIGKNASVFFVSTQNSLTINGAPYTLVDDTATLASDIAANPNGNFALSNNYGIPPGPPYRMTAIVTTAFNGNFQGLGHKISHVRLAGTAKNGTIYVGFFSSLGANGTIANFRLDQLTINSNGVDIGGLVAANFGVLIGDSVQGKILGSAKDKTRLPQPTNIGGLVGANYGAIVGSDASAVVTFAYPSGLSVQPAHTGGLAGRNAGSIDVSYAAGGRIWSEVPSEAGGLVGLATSGTITNSYSTDMVGAFISGDSSGESYVGGLVGWFPNTNGNSSITNSYSSGQVTTEYSGGDLGGLIGNAVSDATPGVVSGGYWDTTSSDISNPAQGAGAPSNFPGITGLTTAQLQSGLPAGFSNAIWGESSGKNGGLPYLLASPPPG